MQHRSLLLLASLSFASLTACGDDKGDTVSTTGGSTSSPTTETATDPGTTNVDPTTTNDPTTGPGPTTTTVDPTTGPGPTTTTDGTTTDATTTADDTTTDGTTTTGVNGPSWAADVFPVLNPPASCDCHNVNAGGLTMQDADMAFANLVGVPAGEAPALSRIEPGDREASYLWHKIQGTHVEVGGSGKMMPLGGMKLPDDTISLIGEWIDAGANP